MNDALLLHRRRLEDWLCRSAFPVWWRLGADLESGGFHEALTQEGEPVRTDRRSRVQTRQVYAYAKADHLGWSGDPREAADHGLEFFITRYARDDGLYRTVVGAERAGDRDEAWLYDQAFALLAFGEAAPLVSRGAELHDRAAAIYRALQSMRQAGGGFIETCEIRPYQSNPHMHLLEAALVWETLEPGARWSALADEISHLALRAFIDKEGAIHEFFAADWSLAPGVDGRIVEPGHQFEWAWLLERWARLRGREDAHRAAVRLFEIGSRHGVDPARGVAFDQMLDDFSPHQFGARLWPQTERLKAALILAEGEDENREHYLSEAEEAAAGLQRYLEVPMRGLWRDKMTSSGDFVEEPAPASSFYHIVCAAHELRRLTPDPGGAPPIAPVA